MRLPQESSTKPLVVVIDDDAAALEFVECVLEQAGVSVRTASNGRDGIMLSQSLRPHVVLLELKLPDMSGLDVLHELSACLHFAEFIVITAFANIAATVTAVKLGATDVVEKPVSAEHLLTLVREPSVRMHVDECLSLVPHARRRWAEAVVKLVDSPDDVRTLTEWGRFAGASRGTLRNWCRTARLSSKRSLALARMLRAVVRGEKCGALPENLLNVVDLRTLSKLMISSGCESRQARRLPNLDVFLQRQGFINDVEAIAELTSVLSTHQSRRAHPIGARIG